MSYGSSQTLHAIVIGDLSPAAGWGIYAPNLTMDMSNMFAILNDNVPEKQLNLLSVEFSENQDSAPAKVLSLIDSLQVDSQDVLLFYFTGHGGSDEQGQHYLALANGPLTRQKLLERLAKHHAKLTVLITDCCSSRSDGKRILATAPGFENPVKATPLFQSLMFNTSGVVDMNSSSPGENAFFKPVDPENFELPGSIFTSELCNWVFDHKQQPRTWDELVRAVSLRVHSSFRVNFPKGVPLAKGGALQTDQNVFAVAYPGKPQNQGPRTGLIIKDYEGRGAVIINVTLTHLPLRSMIYARRPLSPCNLNNGFKPSMEFRSEMCKRL